MNHHFISTYAWPGRLQTGFGASELVGEEAKRVEARQVFIVADPAIAAAGLLEPVTASLQKAGSAYVVYDKVKPDPDIESVEAGSRAFQESEAELIVGVGGGSGIDTAKGIRLLANGDGRIADYDLYLGEQARPVPAHMPPLIAIPTTAGTGSEVTMWAVITDPARKLKLAVGDDRLIPTVGLVDPGLMLSLPPYLTAGTGMDALTHCIESYVSTTDHPLLDAMTLQGIEMIGRSLRTAVAQGANRSARQEMALAATIGGIALNCKWGGACHSLAHQLSTFANVHHGVANALMLPHQMAFSLTGALEKYAQVGQALGTPQRGSLRQRAERAVEAVRELATDLGLPSQLREVGVTEEMIPEMAKNAYIDTSWLTNPRMISEAQMAQLYREAY
jgi:alcohol dehydrogenase class IV